VGMYVFSSWVPCVVR